METWSLNIDDLKRIIELGIKRFWGGATKTKRGNNKFGDNVRVKPHYPQSWSKNNGGERTHMAKIASCCNYEMQGLTLKAFQTIT